MNLGDSIAGPQFPTYFIADISANHDGDLDRAKMLIHLAAEAGADAAKFQNFRAPEIVSDRGFSALNGQLSHQANWQDSVFEVYQKASLPWHWTPILKSACEEAGIAYFSTPYDFASVDMLDPFVTVFKIGSGDITWPEMLIKIADKGKPVLLATGASDMREVKRAADLILSRNPNLCLMQCNTNYTGSLENFNHIHLRVLTRLAEHYPGLVLGLSDHTPGHATVLGAVALGARIIEKHFTDDNQRPGPDHPFSMTPASWREMVSRTRELERALGQPEKVVAQNELETVIVQRRCLRALNPIPKGATLTRDMIAVLRPAPVDGIFPYDIDKVLGRTANQTIQAGQHLTFEMIEMPAAFTSQEPHEHANSIF